jgi:hypothetical protein
MKSNKIDIDTNIEHYTVSELLTILDLDTPEYSEITKKTDYYIKKFEKENNKEMVDFFNDIQDVLLDYSEQLENDKENDENPEVAELGSAKKQSTDWFQNQALKQKNPIQKNKITERKQKIETFNDNHVPMNRQQLGVSNNFNVDVAQDVLNPNLKNTTSRIIVLDSQYRQSSNPNETASDYTLDLSEPLINVLSLRLYSFSIPYTWYAIDYLYGNTCFWLTIFQNNNQTNSTGTNGTNILISIESGNYTNSTIVTALTNSIIAVGIDISGIQPISSIPGTAVPVYINPISGKMTLNLYGATYNGSTIDENTVITFFDTNAELTCGSTCASTMAINQTLGWILGYRVPIQNINKNGNSAIAIIDLYGPKYFILVIDDLNQNHINNGLISITEMSKLVKLPNYYSADLPYKCIPANPTGTNIATNSSILKNDEDAGTLIIDKLNATYSPTQQILPSAPRILTQAQIYSVNEIIKNNQRTYNYKLKSPVVSDTFAILPIKLGNMKTGDMNVEFGGSMQDNKRIYFGPVNISRIRVKLLDDKGHVVNLNGCDWCVTIISENLYQY